MCVREAKSIEGHGEFDPIRAVFVKHGVDVAPVLAWHSELVAGQVGETARTQAVQSARQFWIASQPS